MKNTITAKTGYRVYTKNGSNFSVLFDGDEPIMKAVRISFNDFKAEIDDNEMFHICEIFTTSKGNQFIYARDEEVDIDYLIKTV